MCHVKWNSATDREEKAVWRGGKETEDNYSLTSSRED